MRFSILPRHDTLLIVFIISLVAVPSFISSGIPKKGPERELKESKHSRDKNVTDSIADVGSDKEFVKEDNELDDNQRQHVMRDNDYESEEGPMYDAEYDSNTRRPQDEIHEAQSYDSGIHDKDSRDKSVTDSIGDVGSDKEFVKEDNELDDNQRQHVMRDNDYESEEGPMYDAEYDSNTRRPQDEIHEAQSYDSGIHDKDSRDKSVTDSIGDVGSDQEFVKEDNELDDNQRQHVMRDNDYESEEGPVQVFLTNKRKHGQSEEQDNQGPMYDAEYYSNTRRPEDEIHEAQSYDSGIEESDDEIWKDKEHFGQGSQSQLKKKKDRHDNKSKTAEVDGAKGMHSSESFLIPQDTVKDEDIQHISTEVKHLDAAVKRISSFVRKTLGNIKKNMHEMAKMVSRVHPIAPSTMSHMIQVTMTKTEKAVRKLCLEPIQKSLSIPPWSAWSSWGTCSLTCGSGGYKLRHRQCQSTSHHQCLGNNFDLSHCVLQNCPATWLSWDQWTSCSATCGNNGHQMRSRMCLTSSEKVHCEGSISEMKVCFSHSCKDLHNNAINGHIHIESKLGNKDHFHMNLHTHEPSKSTNTSSGHVWSTWSGWTTCEQCWKGNRKRMRMCVNSRKQPDNKNLCPGADAEFGPCVGPACNHDNAVYVSEGQSVELKCPKPQGTVPTLVFWITPRKQRIRPHSDNKRIHMSGSSLLVDDARYADQGIYSCILLIKGSHHMVETTLLVDTCKTRQCQNGGACKVTSDPEFDGIMNYKCSCTGKYQAPFCVIRSINVGKYIGPIIILIILLMLVIGLALCLLRRSLRKAKIDSLGENQWKKEGTLQTEKKTKPHKTDGKPVPMERPEDKADIANASIVSNDGSFVEITEHDYVDFDGFDLPQEEKNPRGGYESGHASDGYEGKFLKYPSPPYKNVGKNYEQKEFDYIPMDSLPEHVSTHPNKPAGVYNDVSAFKDVSSGNIENFYENLSSEQRARPFYPPPSKGEQEYIETMKYKASLKQGKASIDREALAQEAVEIVAKNLTRQCLVEIENESQNPTKIVSTALNSSQMRSDSPGPNKYQPHGRPGNPNTNMTDISAVNSKSPKKKTKSTQREETANLQTKHLNRVPQNTAPGDVSDPAKDNRPAFKKGGVIPPESQGFVQQLLTQTEGRRPMVSKNRNPVPKARRIPEDTTRQSQIRSPVSPTHRRYVFPMTLSVKDKQQEAEFLKHFATSFSSQPVSPTTSTPKKNDKIACMNVIMPSDIMKEEEDDSETLGKKGKSGELMVVTSSKVLGKREQEPVTRGRGNISSNNRQTSASEMSSGSEVFSDSYYQSLTQVSEPTDLSGGSFCTLDTPTVEPTDLSGGSRFRTLDTSTARPTDLSGGSSFRTLDRSMSLQAMPDLDNTVSFPKLTISYHEESLGQAAGSWCPSNPGQDGSLFQGEITEGSVYLSDYNYTQGTPDELSESQCSGDHTSDDDDASDDDDDDDDDP
ncbi:uncharacterized protein LOC124139085 isoform X2 [Haliotis rufescens]|uniref:uncharacterized protein LOC124139085 isoform X2 n=1 Tax=Haliotis rufescens TaxID=6454 RepID=UPI00201F4FAD|nr:uncharacterized protein LOC124139085 isoform X2 [Haliotis rufescens]